MRVLIIQPWIRAGGAELLSVELAAALERGQDEALIAALFVDPHGLPASARDRRYALPPRWLAARFARSRALTFLIGPFALFWVVLRAAAHADLLNPHNLPAPLIAAIVGPLCRRPVVWTCNEVPAPLSAAEAARIGALDAFIWRVGSAASRFAARVPREILVLSDKTRRAVRDAYGRDATVIRAGVDGGAFRAVHATQAPTLALLWVGKLHPQKDPHLAVSTLAVLRARGIAATLTLVGDGPERGSVKALVRSLGLGPLVRLERSLDLPALVDRYRMSDVLLVTAGGHQSWGLTPFEALAAGTPSVVSDEAGAAELLGPREAALVVPRQAVAFADAVARLATEPGLAQRLVTAGGQLLPELTWARYAAACRDAYARALGASSGSGRR